MPFAAQRVVFLALLLGMTAYAVAVAVVLQVNEGKGIATAPIPELDAFVVVAGVAFAGTALLLRSKLRSAAERLTGPDRSGAQFRATLIPLAMIEGGCVFGTTVWLLNGNPVPGLVVAMVLLALAIYLVPFADPDQR